MDELKAIEVLRKNNDLLAKHMSNENRRICDSVKYCTEEFETRKLAITAKYFTEEFEACKLAIVALYEKQERESPKPLSLEELREMVGEPVWLANADPKDQWAQITFVDSLTVGFVCFGDGEKWACRTANYGKTWIAYRHKLKEADHAKG